MTNDPNQPQPPQYGGQPQAPGTYAGATPYRPEHPQGTTILILGILSLVVCQLLGPVAWYMGGKARKEVAASPTGYSNSNLITIGWVMGIISTVLLIFTVVIVIFAFVLAASAGTGA